MKRSKYYNLNFFYTKFKKDNGKVRERGYKNNCKIYQRSIKSNMPYSNRD
jgi:hypothetical protein